MEDRVSSTLSKEASDDGTHRNGFFIKGAALAHDTKPEMDLSGFFKVGTDEEGIVESILSMNVRV